jgi:hypothetical protein
MKMGPTFHELKLLKSLQSNDHSPTITTQNITPSFMTLSIFMEHPKRKTHLKRTINSNNNNIKFAIILNAIHTHFIIPIIYDENRMALIFQKLLSVV